MASVSGGLGDILSLALKKTGVSSGQSPSHQFDPSSVLNEAAGVINNSLLSSDLNTLTQGLFSDLATVKGASSSSQNTANAANFPESVVPSVQASPPRNGTIQVHTPTSTVAESLSMPVLVKLPSSTTEQSTSYPQNSIQYRPVSTPSASTPITSVSEGFSQVSGGARPITTSTFGSQGETPSPTTNSNQAAIKAETVNADQYNYNSVLHSDNLDWDSLDEFFAADPMDMPPPLPAPPGTVYQNHQFPPAYSSHQQHAPVAINTNTQGLLYSQSGVANHQSPSLMSNTNVSPYAVTQQQYPQGHQPQANMAQYGIQQQQQQPMMAQCYQGQGSMISSPQPHAQQMVVVATCAPSINPTSAGHFQSSTISNVPMATDLSNIMPSSSSILPSLGTNGSAFDMPSLSGEEISSILELDGDDLNFDLNQFALDGGSSGGNMMNSDPFTSFGMSPSTDLIQPSNTVRLNGSSLVNSPMGSAVNAPHQMSYGNTAQPPRPAYTTALQLQQQQQQRNSRLNMHGPMYGRSGVQGLSKMSIPRARNVGMGRGAGIPMPAEPVVSHVHTIHMGSCSCL